VVAARTAGLVRRGSRVSSYGDVSLNAFAARLGIEPLVDAIGPRFHYVAALQGDYLSAFSDCNALCSRSCCSSR
jgi:hypothetical protein